MASLKPGGSSRSGQALIESCLVVALICLVFFGVFQLSQLFASQEVLDYAAGRGARARTVGFNDFMVKKTIRVGAIPNAGRLINPGYVGGPSAAYALESARIPLYLGAEDSGRLRPILDYDAWDTITNAPSYSMGDGTLRQGVQQNVPLRFPFHRAFYNADSVPLEGEIILDEHYTLYMEDAGW
ncbi:MAG: TadE family protein [bacterium]